MLFLEKYLSQCKQRDRLLGVRQSVTPVSYDSLLLHMRLCWVLLCCPSLSSTWNLLSSFFLGYSGLHSSWFTAHFCVCLKMLLKFMLLFSFSNCYNFIHKYAMEKEHSNIIYFSIILYVSVSCVLWPISTKSKTACGKLYYSFTNPGTLTYRKPSLKREI